MPAVYLTIWVAVALFTAAELGRARSPRTTGWAWYASVLGLALAVVHTLLAFDFVHGWSHDDAVLNTAMQTERVFGMGVGWGVYVNYLFFLVWLMDLIWWRRDGRVDRRPRAATIALQAFYFVIVINAAVIFAIGWRRLAGLALVSLLLSAWWKYPRAIQRRSPRG
jgi:hypothetical protein